MSSKTINLLKKPILFISGGFLLIVLFCSFPVASAQAAPSVSLIGQPPTNVRVYEKYEINFNVNTVSQYPFFQYDETPPTGVTPKIGVTVEGVFQTPSGEKRQPSFYLTRVNRNGSGNSMRFEETNEKYWAVRFSPQVVGTYQVSIHVKDSSGEITVPVGSFNATSPVRKGFIKVSKADSRYFEFQNGDLYWPIGPAWSENHSANPNSRNYDYSQYKDTGQSLDRFWMGGTGAYTTNWSRWITSAELHGNEGYMAPLNFSQHYPSHELSYEIFYPEGYRMWLSGSWGDPLFGAILKAGARYQVKLTFKAVNIQGPSSRCPSCPYGLVVRTSSPDIMYEDPSLSRFESALRNAPIIVSHQRNADWQTVTTTFNNDSQGRDLYLYLDNVTAGQVYIDEFSMKEIDSNGNLIGGEVVRNSRADQHTYVEQRPAAFFDWLMGQGEDNGVFFKLVVHDKNDWIQNHLNTNGQFVTYEASDGYYQPENTKARWLLRQWYRYLIARWGYSTAVHSWELNNEGPPGCCENTDDIDHLATAQAFAKFMHNNDSHPHLATTSFWCCWRPAFWGNRSGAFPDLDYADLHDYTGNSAVEELERGEVTPFEEVDWAYKTSIMVGADRVGKPVMRAESGLDDPVTGGPPITDLQRANPGVWYHNLLWVQLNAGAMSDPNYWYMQHLSYINREAISSPFYNFVKSLDLNKGGYVDAQATVSNSNLRTFGQKNLTSGKAHLWIQNRNHLWKKVMDNPGGNYQLSGTTTIKMKPNASYKVEWWDTNNGRVVKAQNFSSDTSGNLNFSVDGFSDDVAIRISPLSSPPSLPGDLNGDHRVDIFDLVIVGSNFGSNTSEGDANGDGVVNIFDLVLVGSHFGEEG